MLDCWQSFDVKYTVRLAVDAWQIEDAYLLGPDLLVAPIVEAGATGRAVYLPDGEWVDFWTGERCRGGGTILTGAGRYTIPVFVRAGAALPLLPEDQGAGRSLVEGQWDDALVLQVEPASVRTRLERRLCDSAAITAEVGPTHAALTVEGGRARTYEVRLPLGGELQVLAGRRLEGVQATGSGSSAAVRVCGTSISVAVEGGNQRRCK